MTAEHYVVVYNINKINPLVTLCCHGTDWVFKKFLKQLQQTANSSSSSEKHQYKKLKYELENSMKKLFQRNKNGVGFKYFHKQERDLNFASL